MTFPKWAEETVWEMGQTVPGLSPSPFLTLLTVCTHVVPVWGLVVKALGGASRFRRACFKQAATIPWEALIKGRLNLPAWA